MWLKKRHILNETARCQTHVLVARQQLIYIQRKIKNQLRTQINRKLDRIIFFSKAPVS